MRDEVTGTGCKQGMGILPACAPLANPYVPFQPCDSRLYGASKGMSRGTLYQGLDLPFHGLVNQENENPTPLEELQTLGFAIQELGLYLDTHRDDMEAITLMSQYVTLYRQGLETIQKTEGPLFQINAVGDGVYRWLHDPWPWEFPCEKEGD